jgi:hypothetical protein
LSTDKVALEFFVYKAVVLRCLYKESEIPLVIDNFLKSIELIDIRTFFNLLMIIEYLKFDEANMSDANELLGKILCKDFTFPDSKDLFKITFELRLKLNIDVDKSIDVLNQIKNNCDLDILCKNLIADNLDKLGIHLEALDFMDSYIDKAILSESLRLYIFILHNQLKSKQQSPKGKGLQLLTLLLSLAREFGLY